MADALAKAMKNNPVLYSSNLYNEGFTTSEALFCMHLNTVQTWHATSLTTSN